LAVGARRTFTGAAVGTTAGGLAGVAGAAGFGVTTRTVNGALTAGLAPGAGAAGAAPWGGCEISRTGTGVTAGGGDAAASG